MIKTPLRLAFYGLIMLLSACLGMPENVKPVTGFAVEKFTGQWYEIARLDHSFERGLNSVTALYTQREDGNISVLNRGFSSENNAWKEAEGVAKFVGNSDTGYLKVSFFGPFYGSYVIFALDQTDYQYAMVAGPSLKYLWILSRTPTMDAELLQSLVGKAQAAGFAVDKLIMVEHAQ